MRRIVFVVPGDLGSLTGGYGYDRRIIAGLRDAGWTVDVLGLDAGYPWPDAAAQARTAALIAAIPDGTVVVADGLAFGAMPDLAELHAQRLRWVALVHHPLALETGLTAAQQAALHASERRALAAARAVVATSAYTARGLADFGVLPDFVAVVEPGVAAAPLARVAEEGKQDQGGRLRLLCVATLTLRKGHLVMIEALAGLKDRAWTLDCVGSLAFDPATVAAVQDAVQAHGLQERVRLHGEVTAQALAGFYHQADLFVLPSHFEGYGMVLTEALAHGLPVCSTTAGAIPETVPADAGVLVPAGDVLAWEAALARLIDEPDWRAGLVRGACRARDHLPDWPMAVSRFAERLAQLG
jgi:glycosyltransferase involved in cell wall biosynthesis